MKLAVIIPAYNHLADVMRCLNTLQAHQYHPNTFHVQDDASPDLDLRECVSRWVAGSARNEHNLGFAGNCNHGAATFLDEHSADVLFFVNQDITAHLNWSHHWDDHLLNAFADPTVGIVGARLLFPDGSVQNAGGVFDQFGQPTHRCLGWRDPHHATCATAGEIEWTTAAALAVRTSLFMQLGGFDERYARGYFEDVDFCLRARQSGAKVWYEPACTLVHSVGSTGGSPYFRANALRFKQQWVDSGVVKPGTLTPTQRYW